MKFIKYPSITNHYAIRSARQLMSRINRNFYVTEKIHGANVSIIFDKELNHKLAKRTEFIDANDEKFEGFVAYFRDNEGKLKSIAHEYFETYPDAEQVMFYGEFHGADVKDMDYDIIKDGKQTVRFFNVLILMDGDVYNTNFEFMQEFFDKDDLVPVLGTGTLRELVQRSDDAISESALGGHAEGVVYQIGDFYNVSKIGLLAVKHKTEEFSEKKLEIVKQQVDLTEKELKHHDAVASRVTKQRLSNVLSHGKFEETVEKLGPIIKAFQADIVEETLREEPHLEKDLLVQFADRQAGEIARLFREYLLVKSNGPI